MKKAIMMIVSTNSELKALAAEGFFLVETMTFKKRRYRLLSNKDNLSLLVLKSGLGAAALGSALQDMINRFDPKIVIHFGTAVANQNNFLNRVFLVASAKMYDFESPWYQIGKIPEFSKEYKLYHPYQGIEIKNVASGNTFVWQNEKGAYIHQITKSKLFDMESAFLAQVAFLNQVALIVFKGVSHVLGTNSIRSKEAYDQQCVFTNRKVLQLILPLVSQNAQTNFTYPQTDSAL